MQEVDDRLECREEGPVERPDPRPAIPHKRLLLGGVEVPTRRLGRRHRAERLAGRGARHTRPNHGLGLPPRWLRDFLTRLEHRQGNRLHGRRVDDVGQRPVRGEPLDQLDDALLLGETPRQLGVGIVVLARAGHRHQVGELVLAPGGIMDPAALILGPGLQAAPIDLDHGQLGSDGHLGAEPVGLKRLDLLLARPPQFLADLMGNPPGLTTADGHFGQIGQTVGRLLERTGAPRGPDDLPQHGRREVVRVEPQGRAEREKN